MAKALYIAEKPSVARTFAEVLGESFKKQNGYEEGNNAVVTWCVGHLVTMSYPEAYDEAFRKWSMDTLPFLPETFLYEVIPQVKKQFDIVSHLLHRSDIDTIYVCTDSGREGEYIYRLVKQMAGVDDKKEYRVWINSQTKEEILRGIKEAKPLSEYNNLSDSAYLRAKEDYLMGINFTRILSLKYGRDLAGALNKKYCVISVGRVMTCVLGMIVRREREIRAFTKQPFYRVLADATFKGAPLTLEWKALEGSAYVGSPLLYSETGFRKEEDAKELIQALHAPFEANVIKAEKKKEKKNPPLLYNLAELQNDASKLFKITPAQTLEIVQKLYEMKLVTYPRTDARVLSSSVAKEIEKNLRGLGAYAKEILENGWHKNLSKTRFVDDKKITDHYAIIPTGQGLMGVGKLPESEKNMYELIMRRFLAIFYPPAIYQKIQMITSHEGEFFQASEKVLLDEGYLRIMQYSFSKKDKEEDDASKERRPIPSDIKKGDVINVEKLYTKEGETTPPKRYNSGSIIFAMENAGQLIEDEELREQIKGSGIGTAATRAGILEKLVKNEYIQLNKKTQILKPTLMGEMIFDVVYVSIRPLLNPELTASWEKGLTMVCDGDLTSDGYMVKMEEFVRKHTQNVKSGAKNNLLNNELIKLKSIYGK